MLQVNTLLQNKKTTKITMAKQGPTGSSLTRKRPRE